MLRKLPAVFSCALLILLPVSLARGADRSPTAAWTPDDMLATRQVGGVQVSPDGKHAAFVVRRAVLDDRTSEFRAQIHVASADGSGAFALTQGDDSCEVPQWSPDGRRIAFLTRRSGTIQIWLIPLHGGEARRLTDAKGGVVSFRWSPDGRRIAYAAADPVPGKWKTKVKEKDDARVVDERVERIRLYVVDAGIDETNGKPAPGRRLTTGKRSIAGDSSAGFDWSPDGKTIVFAHVPTPGADDWTRSDLSLVDVDDGNVTRLVHTPRAESAPWYSPDGRWIAYVASDDPPTWAYDSALYLIPANGGKPRKLADSFDHRPELLGWTADGEGLIFRENRGTTTRLYSLRLEGEPSPIALVDGVIPEAALNASRTAIGFSFQTAEEPLEAFLTRLDRPEAVQVSRINHDVVPPDRPLGRTEAIHWKSADGRPIEGLLTYPANYVEGTRYPLLLIIHGGPAGIFTRTFTGSVAVSTSSGRSSYSTYPIAVFASRGYAVLRCNVRGSSGYGKEFRHANHDDWGGGDYNDLMAGVDHVIARGIADPGRLGVMGWSYGGFMTSWVIGHTARFKAASVGAGVTDLVSFEGTSDIADFLPSFFGGEAWDRPEAFREHSPISHVKGIRTPTLIQHGADDERVPIGQGYELYNALKRQGCEVQMVVYPRAHHAIQEPKLLLDAMRRNVDWFEHHVRARGPETAAERNAGR